MSDLDLGAALRGAASAAIVAVPLAVVLGLLARRAEGAGSLGGFLVAVLIVLALFAGFAGGRLAPGRRLTHGAISGVILFVAIQLTSSLVRGSLPNPVGVAYTALLYSCLGVLGGMLANRWMRQRSDEPAPEANR